MTTPLAQTTAAAQRHTTWAPVWALLALMLTACGGGGGGDESDAGEDPGGGNTAAPVARPDSATAHGGEPLIIDVLANDDNAPVGEVTVGIESPPQHGSAGVESDGRIRYLADSPDFSGSDQFTYSVTTADGATASATVSLKLVCAGCVPSTLQLAWDAPQEPVLGYRIYVGSPEPDEVIHTVDVSVDDGTMDTAAPAFAFDSTELGLGAGDRVCFRLRAYNLAGMSGFSESICGEV